MGGGVLRFIKHHHGVVERATAHKCQRGNLNHIRFHIFLQFHGRNHIFEGIVERLQIRVDFVLHISRKKSEFFAGFHRRTREDNFPHLAIFECSHRHSHRQVGFAGARRTEGKGKVAFADGFHQQLLIRRARLDRLAIHTENNGVVHFQFFGRRTFYGVDNHIVGELIVVVAKLGKFLDFLLKESRFFLLANHLNHIAASSHAQLGKEVTNQLNIGIIDTIENHGVNVIDNYVSFYHSVESGQNPMQIYTKGATLPKNLPNFFTYCLGTAH